MWSSFNRCPALEEIWFNNTKDYWTAHHFSARLGVTVHFSDDGDYQLETIDGVEYRIYPEFAIVTGAEETLTEITIPEEVHSVPVTEIHDNAFQNCKTLNSIHLPETLTKIGTRAFWGAENLQEINFPLALQLIEINALSGTAIQEIQLPENVSLERGVFENCPHLETVHFPENLKEIPSYAFADCPALQEVTIPETVTNIGMYAFMNCSALKEITLPKSVCAIEEAAFRNCSALEKVVIFNNSCEISMSKDTFCNHYEEIELPPEGCIIEIEQFADFTGEIYGYPDSTAQTYAETYDRKFVPLGENPSETPETYSAGDADGDGEVNILDVILVNRAILGKTTLSEKQVEAVDFNKNGYPEPAETLMMMKYIVGIITDFS